MHVAYRLNITIAYPSATGVEVLVFHWGCTRLLALGDDQRGPIVCARGGTERTLPLQGMS